MSEENNINTQAYWDSVYRKEKENAWRSYPKTRELICATVEPTATVLEFGCGQGDLAVDFITRGNLYFGVDISKEAIKYALNRVYGKVKNKKMYEFYTGDILDLQPFLTEEMSDFSAGSFDYVIATEFLEHFKDPVSVLKTMKLYGKSVIIVVPNMQLTPEQCKEHYQCFDLFSLEATLQKAGFVVTQIIEFREKFESGKIKIELPCLMAVAR